jgi:hypothetical protein
MLHEVHDTNEGLEGEEVGRAHDGERTQLVGVFAICNMAGMERKHFKRETLSRISASIQNVLPVRIGGVCLVHEPLFFDWLWFFVRIFIGRALRERIRVLGGNDGSLVNWVDPVTSLPPDLGGSKQWDHASWLRSFTTA